MVPEMFNDELIEAKLRDGLLGAWSPELIRLINEKRAAEARLSEHAAIIGRLKREVREAAPRTFPMQCFLCEGKMESTDDYEWHGLGDCVPLCNTCNGNGFIDHQKAAYCKFAAQHHLGACPHCGAALNPQPSQPEYTSESMVQPKVKP